MLVKSPPSILQKQLKNTFGCIWANLWTILNSYSKEEKNESRTIPCVLYLFPFVFLQFYNFQCQSEPWLIVWMDWLLLNDKVATSTLFINHFASGLTGGCPWHIVVLPELEKEFYYYSTVLAHFLISGRHSV